MINQIYCVQGKIINEPLFFYSKNKLAILSFIIHDADGERIECVSFGKEAETFKKKLEINKIYQINFVNTIKNEKFVKTNHRFKLQLTIDSEITKSHVQKYSRNKKICVKIMQKRNKIKKDQNKQIAHQLSIVNWLKH